MGISRHPFEMNAGPRLLWKGVCWLVMLNIGMISIGIITYNGPFLFWKDPLSNLGATENLSGKHNFLSPFFFGTGLLCCSLICFRIAKIWQTYHILPGQRVYVWLMYMAGTGYILMIAPCNLCNTIHTLGSVLVFGSFWFFMVFLIRVMADRLGYAISIVLHILLNGTLLPYAITYMILRLSVKQFYQKIAVVGMLISLLLIVRILFSYELKRYKRSESYLAT